MNDLPAPAPAEVEPVRLPPEVAADALVFLSRAPLQFSEIDAALRVRVTLEAIAMKR